MKRIQNPNGCIYTQNIGILFFIVRSKNFRNITIVNTIYQIIVLWMVSTKWSINYDFYNISNHYINYSY